MYNTHHINILSGKVKRFDTFYLTRIMMRDLDVKPTPSRDLDIKRDYQLKLRQLLFKNTLMDILKL